MYEDRNGQLRSEISDRILIRPMGDTFANVERAINSDPRIQNV